MLDMFLDAKDIHEGAYLEARFKVTSDYSVWGETYIPIYIEKEYPKFFLCTVLEHKNPSGQNMGISKPYPMTIDKHNLKRKEVLVRYPMV